MCILQRASDHPFEGGSSSWESLPTVRHCLPSCF
jgi:hypothetical protein